MALRSLAAVAAALVVAPLAVTGAAAQADVQASPGSACIESGKDTRASKFDGAYTASFDAYGEELTVKDHASDGDAAVAYVRVYDFWRCRLDIPEWYDFTEDTDRFVMSIGEDTYNLGTPDGSGDIDEDDLVEIMVCRGYKSIPGDNCSPWRSGIA